jgi:hypothetical protein
LSFPHLNFLEIVDNILKEASSMTIGSIPDEVRDVFSSADGVTCVDVNVTVHVVLRSEPGVSTSQLEAQLRGLFPKGVTVVVDDKR